MNVSMHDTAAMWQLKLAAGPLDPADEQSLADWLARDRAHRIALAEAGIAYYGATQAHPDALPTSRRVVSTRARRWTTWTAGAVAVPLIALVVALLPRWWAVLGADAHTGPGEVLTVDLPDGSRAVLDADSAIAWEFTPGARELRVLRGAAGFDVEPDASRPFRVSADGVTATAVGTAYTVDARGPQIVVQVSHGVVQVDAPSDADGARLTAGEQVRVSAGELAPAPIDPRSAAAGAWRDGLISFHDEPLAEAVARLDRYLPQRLLLLGDGSAPVSAVFPLADAQLAAEALARSHGLRVRRLPGLIVLGG